MLKDHGIDSIQELHERITLGEILNVVNLFLNRHDMLIIESLVG